jgi:hypothetical protein
MTRSLQSLDEGIQRRDSAIARTMRAETWASRALETADPRDVELALLDLDVAKNMQPNSPQVISTSVYASLVAVAAYEDTGQMQMREAALQRAAKEARTLEQFDTLPGAVWGQFYYYWYISQDNACSELLRRAFEGGTPDDLIYRYAFDLYQRRQLPQALEVLGRSKNHDVVFIEVPRAFILAEVPGGYERALKVSRNLTSRCVVPVDRWGCNCLLLFLGLQAESVTATRRFREQDQNYWLRRGRWVAAQHDYLCEDISAEELLKPAGRSKYGQCSCHLVIGLKTLANGDRSGAREHFRKAVATRFFTSTSYGWSRGFLARMEVDPTWPPWIPVKK